MVATSTLIPFLKKTQGPSPKSRTHVSRDIVAVLEWDHDTVDARKLE